MNKLCKTNVRLSGKSLLSGLMLGAVLLGALSSSVYVPLNFVNNVYSTPAQAINAGSLVTVYPKGSLKDILSMHKYEVVEFKGVVTDQLVNGVIAQLEKVKLKNPKANVLIDIDSPGGSVPALMMLKIYLEGSDFKITTLVRSGKLAASAGAMLFMLGDERYLDDNAKVLFHGVHTGDPAHVSVLAFKKISKVVHSDLFVHLAKAITHIKDESGFSLESYLNSKELKTIQSLDTETESLLFDLAIKASLMGTTQVKLQFDIKVSTLVSSCDAMMGVFDKYLKSHPGTSLANITKDLFLNYDREELLAGNKVISMGYAKKVSKEFLIAEYKVMRIPSDLPFMPLG